MSGPLFAGARAKVERAKHHIADLDRAFTAYVESDPYSLDVYPHADGDWQIGAQLKTRPPTVIALCLGDAVHNLRTALDHATWELIGRDCGTQDRWTSFPTGATKRDYDATCNGIKTPRADTKAFFAAQAAYPKGRGDALYSLSLLDNGDKHTVLTPIVSIGWLGNITVTVQDEHFATIDNLKVRLDEAGPVYSLFRGFPDGSLFEVDKKSKTTPEIEFGEADALKGDLIQPTLVMLCHKVEECLREFETFVVERPA